MRGVDPKMSPGCFFGVAFWDGISVAGGVFCISYPGRLMKREFFAQQNEGVAVDSSNLLEEDPTTGEALWQNKGPK